MEFIGRDYELGLLEEKQKQNGAKLVIVYGRRRVGKTRLVEEFYKDKNLWKFDGLERQPKAKQIRTFLNTLFKYTKKPLLKTAICKDWLDAFKLLDVEISRSPHRHRMTLFLDELPYMAGRRIEMISDLKWAWDNLWSKKSGFTLVLCGSVASFMVDSVINSSALYGRIDLEICLKPFSLGECYKFFGGKRSHREVMMLYMFCGGIPAYLLQTDKNASTAANINRLAFCKDGYFTKEFHRIFKDVFHEERVYGKIIALFGRYKSLKVAEILQSVAMSGGSGFNRYLNNLEKAGFICRYTPCGRPATSKLDRYRLDDEYLHFYFKFILPNLKKIEDNAGGDLFSQIMRSQSYQSWAGLAFERLCFKHVGQIMKALKIDQLVTDYGPYFDRNSNTKESTQIDLMFLRHDPVITVCEMKYYAGKIGKWIIDEMEQKTALLRNQKKDVEKVLITTEGLTKDVEESGYFSKVLLADCLFGNL